MEVYGLAALVPAGRRRRHRDRGQRPRGSHPVRSFMGAAAPGGGDRRAAAAPVGPRAGDDSRGHGFKRHADALLHPLDDGIAAASQLIEPETGPWHSPLAVGTLWVAL